MKLTISTFVLSFALATLSEAKIATFTYSGVISSKGGINCSGRIGYQVNDDGDAAPYKGSFGINGCIGGQQTLDDGVFTLDVNADDRTATLTEKSTGLQLKGTESEHVGSQAPCRNASCPVATKEICYFGAGPDGTEPTTKTCGLSG